jgi:hypothetical protein
VGKLIEYDLLFKPSRTNPRNSAVRGRADCCSGNKAHPVPASSCSLVFRSCEIWFAKETRARSVGKEACTRTPQQGMSHSLGDRTLGIRRDRLLSAKHEHSAEPCLIASCNLSPCCCVVNPTKGAIFHCTFLVVVFSCRRSREMRCRASGFVKAGDACRHFIPAWSQPGHRAPTITTPYFPTVLISRLLHRYQHAIERYGTHGFAIFCITAGLGHLRFL